MKQLFVLLFLLVCSCSLQAQNNQVKIILKSGVVIKGILKELNPAEYAIVNVAGIDSKILIENVESIENNMRESQPIVNNYAIDGFDTKKIGNYRITDNGQYPESFDLIVNGEIITMLLVRGGTFNMGYDGSGSLGMKSEPVHQVILSSYYISKECLNVKTALYLLGKEKKSYKDVYYSNTWKYAKQIVDKLAANTQKPYRMLTEAEWEYASLMPNAEEIWTKDKKKLGQAKGIEWCSDFYDDYSAGIQTNPQGPTDGSRHVFRSFRFGKNKWDRRAGSNPVYDACIRVAISADAIK